MGNPVCHIEIPTTNLEESKRFYETVFGWEITAWGNEPYWLFTTGEGATGGAFFGVDTACEEGVVLIIEVDDIPAMLTKIEENGGEKLMEKTPIGENAEMGYYAYFNDSVGGKMGLWSKN